MYQRFRDSIVTPANIVEFRNDKLIWVFLYILFFALLLSTRMIIDTITYDGLSQSEQNAVIDELPVLDEDCGFSAYEYICDTTETTLLYSDMVLSYYLDSHDELQYDNYESQYNIVIQGSSIHMIFNNRLVLEERLDTYAPNALLDLDFSLQSDDPDLFEDKVVSVIDDFIVSYKPIWGPMLVLVDFITGLILFFAFILLSAMMMRLRFKEVPYRQMFVMNAYSATAFYLILIFNSLFELNFLLIILLIFIAFRQNNQLSFEILRRLQKRPPKE